MSSSQRIETTTAQAAPDAGLTPYCPVCGSPMVVRALRHGDQVDGLYWGCRRPMVCSGTRKIRDPLVIQPTADASTQAIFEWERSRDRRGWVGGDEPAATSAGGFFGRLGRAIPRQTTSPQPSASFASAQSGGSIDGLVDFGFIVLDRRQIASAHVGVDHVVVGPTGIFIVDRKPWPGQLSSSSDSVYVDGRQRTGATDNALRAAAALDDALGYELKPLGTSVKPIVSFDRATNRNFEGTVGKVSLAATRSLAKVIRAGQPTLGPETVIRLALAADRLLD